MLTVKSYLILHDINFLKYWLVAYISEVKYNYQTIKMNCHTTGIRVGILYRNNHYRGIEVRKGDVLSGNGTHDLALHFLGEQLFCPCFLVVPAHGCSG